MNVQMMVTYIGVDFFCIIMAVTMGNSVRGDFGSEFEVRSLRRALASYVAFLVLGLVWMLTQNSYLPYNTAVAWITNSLSLFCMNLTSYYWFLFAMARIRRMDMKPNGLQYLICKLPIAAAAVLCFTTPFTHLVFDISADGEYRRGILFVFVSSLQYLYSLCVCVYAVWYGVHEKNKERRELCWQLGLFIILPMLAGIVQIVVGNTPIIAPAIITAFFIVYVHIQRSQVYNDSLTGMNNRKRLFDLMETRSAQLGKDHGLIVYMVDADSFKEINDRYGHGEGDRALVLIAESMKQLAGEYHLFVARYGGDEFSMVDWGADLAEPEEVISRMREILRTKCEESRIDYSVTVSIGYTHAKEAGESPEALIARADDMMYRQKAERKGRRK